MNESKTKNESLIGIIYAILAFSSWGVLPLYWKLLKNIPADEILATRIIWAFIFVLFILVYRKQLDKLKETVFNRKNFFRSFLCAIMIATNWFIYIWAVKSNHLIEVSMGYYINPLIVVLLGMIILKEKLNHWQKLSLIFAIIGVGIITISYGKVPWVSLSLALSFGIYGLLKKLIKTESIVGLGIETLIMLPIAIGYIVFKGMISPETLNALSNKSRFLLPISGIATAGPLICFSEGAKRIPLSMLGFLQYIYPTISLMIGIFIFKEEFTKPHFIGFGFIWLGLLIYSLSQVNILKKTQQS